MDYETYQTLRNIAEFITNYCTPVACAGMVGGLYAYIVLYEKTIPIVEGEVIETNYTNKKDSRIKIRTEKDGDLELILNTKMYKWGILINAWCGVDYSRKIEKLAMLLSVGSWVKAKVEEKQGLERQVYKLLNVYL